MCSRRTSGTARLRKVCILTMITRLVTASKIAPRAEIQRTETPGPLVRLLTRLAVRRAWRAAEGGMPEAINLP
jgi:hypothetical protein